MRNWRVSAAVRWAADGTGAENAPSGSQTGGQTIFHPEDEVQLSLLQITCGTCADGYDHRQVARSERLVGELAVSQYTYRCTDPRCQASVLLQVFCDASRPRLEVLPAVAGTKPPKQTIFHEDDGVALGRVGVLCGTCEQGPMYPVSKTVEDDDLGAWTVYVFDHRQTGCPVRILLRVPHEKTLEELGKAGGEPLGPAAP